MPLTLDILRRYKATTFLETGTNRGLAVDMALEAGFKLVLSVECSRRLFQEATVKYQDDPRVCLWHGDSVKCLPDMLRLTKRWTLFWLDAHYGGLDCAAEVVDCGCPILKELAIIAEFYKGACPHTLLVDDLRMFPHPEFDNITRQQLKDAVIDCNRNYEFTILDGYIPSGGQRLAGDILVARLP